MYEILTRCPLFDGLDKDTLEELFSRVPSRRRKFSKGEMIAQSGDEITALWIVMQGSVRGEMVDFTGKTIKIEDIGVPRPLAPAFMFGQYNVFPVNIVANEASVLLDIPKSSFIQLMQMNSGILSNFLNIISNRAQFLSNKIKFLSFQSIKGKLAHYLLQRIKKADQKEIILDRSQAQLAELFGVTRPSLGRAISEMNRDGIIRTNARNIRILDQEKLSSLLR